MTVFYIKSIPWILALYSASIFYWNYFNTFDGWYYFMIILIITFLLKLLISWVVEQCLPWFKHESDRGVASEKFTHDYDWENPVTKWEADIAFLKNREEKETDADWKKEIWKIWRLIEKNEKDEIEIFAWASIIRTNKSDAT